MIEIVQFFKKQWFILSLVVAVSLGISFPQVSALNEGSWITNLIVFLVFLGMGFTLPSEALITGLTKWRIHLFLQCFIFLAIPAIFFVSLACFKHAIATELYIGLLALAVLPTTISTCTVFTQLSGGDVVLSLFNSSLSNLLGVFVSPLLLSLLLQDVGRVMPLSVLIEIVSGLALKMVLPLMIGQVLRYMFLKTTAQLKRIIGVISNLMILTIVFFTLAKSASTPLLGESLNSLLFPVAYLVLIHFVLILIATGFARFLKLTGTETITILYAAPQKTLAMGVPLLSAYFANDPMVLGVAILPLLFYHPWQLLVAGVLKSLPIVRRWSRE